MKYLSNIVFIVKLCGKVYYEIKRILFKHKLRDAVEKSKETKNTSDLERLINK